MMDLKDLIKERKTLRGVKAGIDRQLKQMKKSNDPNMELSIRQFEELSWDLELDISILDEAIANYIVVSRRFVRCNELDQIEEIPYIH